jgi:hypothetical protein
VFDDTQILSFEAGRVRAVDQSAADRGNRILG